MTLPNIVTGTWLELPGTTFKAFADANGIPAFLPHGGNGRATIFTAWNSGLFDRIRNLWVTLRAGGHADTPQNGVYAFSINTLAWSILRPSIATEISGYGSAGYPPLIGDSSNLFAPSRLLITSTDATDNRTATINGENVAGTTLDETIQINGTTPVLTTTTWRWINSIQMSGPNINENLTLGIPKRLAFFRLEDDSTGVWPTSKQLIPSTASGISRVGGPFNILNENKYLGASAYYLNAPTVADFNEPSSVHTYDSQAHLVIHDRYASLGGILWGYGASTPNTMWFYNPNTNTWGLPNPGSTARPGGGTCCSIWDPTLNILWLRVSTGLYTYDFPTNTLTQRHTSTVGGTTNSKLIIDNEGRKLYLVWPTSGTAITLLEYNISNPNAVTLAQIATTGAINIRKGGSTGPIEGIGAVWIGNRIAVYGNDETGLQGAIYTLDPNTPVWNIQNPISGVRPPSMENTGGVWNKFFSPDDIHLCRILTETQNVWAYKVPWSTGASLRPAGVSARIL